MEVSEQRGEVVLSPELIKGSQVLATEVQTLCEGMLRQDFEGSSMYCSFIQSGHFAEAADFAHAQLLKADNVQEKTKWLRLNNGAKAQVFLDMINRWEVKRADIYARGQLRWYSADSIQLEKILQRPYFDQLRWEFTRLWSDLLQKLQKLNQPALNTQTI